MGFLMTCYWTPVVSFVSLEALCIGIVIVAIVLVALLIITLKKSIILSQPDTCVCYSSTSGKTVASGLSLSVQPSFWGKGCELGPRRHFPSLLFVSRRWEEPRCLVGVLQVRRWRGNDGTWQEMDEEYFGGEIWLHCLRLWPLEREKYACQLQSDKDRPKTV